MIKTLNLLVVGCSIPIVISLAGFLSVAFNVINVKNRKLYALLLSTLLTAIEMWLATRSQIDLGDGGWDLFILFFVLWFGTFFVFWLGTGVGLMKIQGSRHNHTQDFVHSSMLSMQYEETEIAVGSEARPHQK